MYKIFIILFLLFLILFETKKSNYKSNYEENNIIFFNGFKENNIKDSVYSYLDVNGNTVISNKWHQKSEVINLNDVNLEVRNIDHSELIQFDYFSNNIPKSLNMRQSILVEELKHEQEHYIKEKNILAKIDERKLLESDIGYKNYIKELKQSLLERENNIKTLKNLLNIK